MEESKWPLTGVSDRKVTEFELRNTHPTGPGWKTLMRHAGLDSLAAGETD